MKSMSILVIAAFIMTYCQADLLRPSPINPEIPMDPKPAEIITVITDPKELAKFKREIHEKESPSSHGIIAPTTIAPSSLRNLDRNFNQPIEEKHQNPLNHRQKRDTKTTTTTESHPSKPLQKPNNQKPTTAPKATTNSKKTPTDLKTSTTVATPTQRKQKPKISSSTTAAPVRSTTTAKSQQVKHRQKRNENDNEPLIDREQHKLPVSTLEHNEKLALSPITFQLAESLPTILSPSEQKSFPIKLQDNIQQQQQQEQRTSAKRDIPVPLVPKYHHPEESPKDDDDDNDKHKEDSKTSKEHTANQNPGDVQVEDLSEHQSNHNDEHNTEHPVYRHHLVPVSQLFAKTQPSTVSVEEGHHEN